jgi:hypothetical protein
LGGRISTFVVKGSLIFGNPATPSPTWRLLEPPLHRTTANTTVTLIDLAAKTTYYLAVRSHPSTEPTIAWAPGWRDLSTIVPCTTAARPAISDVRRVGELAETSVGLAFDVVAEGELAASHFEVGVLRAPSLDTAESTGAWSATQTDYSWTLLDLDLTAPSTAMSSGRASYSGTVTGLSSGSTFFVVVRPGGRGAANSTMSDATMFRTAATGSLYTVVHRISEYAEDVDFLENHDSASVEAMPLYLMTCSPEGNCQPWNKTQFTKTDADWDSCEVALASICPTQRGIGFNGCVQCVDDHHDEVVAACGNYTDKDQEHPGYPVHYYCGIGPFPPSHPFSSR